MEAVAGSDFWMDAKIYEMRRKNAAGKPAGQSTPAEKATPAIENQG